MRSTTVTTRHAFTLIELLVVIAIIAILVALLLPAVQQVREAARKSQCQDNLHNIGLAVHSYESSHKVLPPGFIDRYPGTANAGKDGGWAFTAMLLPQLEQKPLFDQLDFRLAPYSLPANWGTISTQNNTLAVATPLEVFTCPSDVRPETRAINATSPGGTDRLAITSYCGSSGSFDGDTLDDDLVNNTVFSPDRNNGVFIVNKSVKFAHITDGTSNVLLLGEVRYIPLVGGDGSDRQFVYGSVITSGGVNAGNLGAGTNGAWLHVRSTRKKMNGPLVGGDLNRAFHSQHAGGAQFCMGDGKVTFISENIDHTGTNYTAAVLNGPYGTYQRLSGMNDGQPIGRF